jgi:hypothetical protein
MSSGMNGSSIPSNYYDEDDSMPGSSAPSDQQLEHINEIRLSETFRIKCSLDNQHSLGNSEYTFQSIVFNRSLLNIDATRFNLKTTQHFIEVDTTQQLDELFDRFTTNWTDHEIIVELAQFSDTGRYYCIYSKTVFSSLSGNDEKSYLITSTPFLIYDG